MTDVQEQKQTITFCGVGGHHQNGIAEKAIRDVCEDGRTTLVHANQLWPEAIRLSLWPYALKHAERIRNLYHLDAIGNSPLEKFSRVKGKPELKHEHPLFCPVYVLDEKLQGSGGLPKWEPRSRAGVFLGHSPTHAGNVAMVLHLQTGHVSCQYHLVFDDTFSTVPHLRNHTKPPNWHYLVETCTKFYGNVSEDKATLEKLKRLDLLEELQNLPTIEIAYSLKQLK